jgi:hypothetical protein
MAGGRDAAVPALIAIAAKRARQTIGSPTIFMANPQTEQLGRRKLGIDSGC